MAASVLVNEKNGAGEVATAKSAGEVRFKSADNATVGLDNPLRIPASGQVHSFEKVLRFHIGATAPSVQITNLVAYLDGWNSFGTGVNLYYAVESTYIQPVLPSAADAIPKHGGVAMTNFFTKTSASPEVLGAGPFSAADTDVGAYLYLVLTVASTAAPGIVPTEALTFSYDEI